MKTWIASLLANRRPLAVTGRVSSRGFDGSGAPSRALVCISLLGAFALLLLGGAPTPASAARFEIQLAGTGTGTVKVNPLGGMECTSTCATGATGTATTTAGSNVLTSLITAQGTGTLTAGSTAVSSLSTAVGRFYVGQPISGSFIPAGTKVVAVPNVANPTSLTLSQPAEACGGSCGGVALSSQGPQPFAKGEVVAATGVPTGTRVTAVGPGTITLSRAATATASSVSVGGPVRSGFSGTATTTLGSQTLTNVVTAEGAGTLAAGSKAITGVTTTAGGFQVGQTVSGAGIPAAATIAAIGAGTIELSAAATASGQQTLKAGAQPFMGGSTMKISGPGIPSNTVISSVSGQSMTMNNAATANASGVAVFSPIELDAISNFTGQIDLFATPDNPSVFLGWSIAEVGGSLGCTGSPLASSCIIGPEPRSGTNGAVTVTASFGPAPTLPTVTSGAASPEPDPSLFALTGEVNPNGSLLTDCRFEYGVEAVGEHSARCTQELSAIGNGSSAVAVGGTANRLRPDTTYSYRLSASNVGGVSHGQEGTFTTGASPDPCPNAARRSEQGPAAEALPECRAYEQITTADSGAANAVTLGSAANTSPDISLSGGRMLVPTVPLPGTPNAVGFEKNVTLAQRGTSGWANQPIAAAPEASQPETCCSLPSAELDKVLWNKVTLNQLSRGEVRWTFTDAGGSLTQAAPALSPLLQSGGISAVRLGYSPVGGSSDLSTFVFNKFASEEANKQVALLPGEALVAQNGNLYEAYGAGGPLATVGLVNQEGPGGPQIGGACGAGLGSNLGSAVKGATRAVSSDGSVVFFSARPGTPAEGSCGTTLKTRIFRRVGTGVPVEIDHSECTRVSPACAATDGDDEYMGASSDGEVAFFTSVRQLANSDEDTTADLYMYDASRPAGSRLTQVSAGEAVAASGTGSTTSGSNVISAVTTASGSGDLSNGSKTVSNLTTATGAFLVGQTITGAGIPASTTIVAVGANSLELSAGATASVAAVPLSAGAQPFFKGQAVSGSGIPPGATITAVSGQSLTLSSNATASATGVAVSGIRSVGSGAEVLGVPDNAADGSRVYFVAKGVLAGANSRSRFPSPGGNNLYVYDATSGATRFVGELAGGDSSFWTNSSLGTERQVYALPALPGGDGRMLVFASSAKLVAEDTDSARDVYRYNAISGQLLCLSCDGNGGFSVIMHSRNISTSAPSAAERSLPATQDGSVVVFATAERLLPADGNSAYDAYEWREDGPEEGRLSLISGATGELGLSMTPSISNPVGIPPAISGNGDDITFVTNAAVTSSDGDSAADLYDARVDGGFPEPEAAAACGDAGACQGTPSAAPAAPAAGSATAGGGNVKPAKRRPHRHKKRHKHRPHRGHQAGRAHGGGK